MDYCHLLFEQTLVNLKVQLAPFLLAADCRSTDESRPVVKSADDTELVGFFFFYFNDEDALYHKQIENCVNWCDKNDLYLNVSETVNWCDKNDLYLNVSKTVNWCDKNDLYLNVSKTVNRCDKNHLYLNVSKTQEMCNDFRKNQRCPKPVYIKGEAVERVFICIST